MDRLPDSENGSPKSMRETAKAGDAVDPFDRRSSDEEHQTTSIATTAAAITSVASQPNTRSRLPMT